MAPALMMRGESADTADMEQTQTIRSLRTLAPTLQVFLYLQLLDFLTTILGFRLGLSEASPFVRMLTQWGPSLGIGLSKVVAITLALTCLLLNRPRVLKLINYWYAVLVAWNLSLMILAGAVH